MNPIDLAFGLEPQDWMERAYCAREDVPADLWFADNTEDTWAAKKLCRTKCPVAEECLKYAFDNDEREGVYGGLSAGERARARAGGPARGRPSPETCHRNHPHEDPVYAERQDGRFYCRTCQSAYYRAKRAS